MTKNSLTPMGKRLNEIELVRHLALNDHHQDLTKEMLQYLGHFYQCVLEIYLDDWIEL